MTKDESNPNGKTPKLDMPAEMSFARSPLKCWNCNRIFEYFVVEQLDDFTQLRCGDVLIASIKMACLHCGRVVSWEMNTKKLEVMAVKYGELSSKLPGYNPE